MNFSKFNQSFGKNVYDIFQGRGIDLIVPQAQADIDTAGRMMNQDNRFNKKTTT